MSKRKTVKKTGKRRSEKTGQQAVVWKALTFTGQLIAQIKNVQLGYIRVGVGLARARDEKIYEVLKHPNLEDYVEKRLGLSKASMYRYLKIYDWVAKNKPEWLLPKPKGRIPDLSDISDAIRIEDTLSENKRMEPSKREGLEELKQKALNGNLIKGVAGRALRKGSKGSDPLKAFTSSLRSLRRSGIRLTSMPPEVIAHLDSAIGILENEHAAAQAGLHLLSVPFASPATAIV